MGWTENVVLLPKPKDVPEVTLHLFTMKILFSSFLPVVCAAALFAPSPLQAGSGKAIDPKALETLQRMSNTLAAAKAFTYEARTISEVPAKSGQFLTLFSTTDVALKRPDKLRAHFAGEAPHFDFFYDGTTAAAFAPATNVYSLSKAPATIDAMLPALEKETGIRFASAGLLFSDPYKALAGDVVRAQVVGQVQVNGTPCEHLAFQAEGVNWEIWIEASARALPLRLAATYTDHPKLPRVLVEFFHWNLHPALRPGDFVFHPPAGSREIPFRSVPKP